MLHGMLHGDLGRLRFASFPRQPGKDANRNLPKSPCNIPCNIRETAAKDRCNLRVSDFRIPPVTSQILRCPVTVVGVAGGPLQLRFNPDSWIAKIDKRHEGTLLALKVSREPPGSPLS